MVDTILEQGFNYFDIAHGYLNGKSELALKECLTSRHKREEYILTDKLTMPYFNKQEDIRPFFESQLEACGVEYFDFYLMHAQSKDIFAHFKKCHAYETALELKNLLQQTDMLSTGEQQEEIPYRFYVSDLADEFEEFANSILPYDVERTQKIDIEKY